MHLSKKFFKIEEQKHFLILGTYKKKFCNKVKHKMLLLEILKEWDDTRMLNYIFIKFKFRSIATIFER